MNDVAFRPLSDRERRLIGRLLGRDFPGRDAVVSQLETASAVEIDENGSIELRCSSQAPAAATTRRVPVEGEAADTDGTMIHYLLHVVRGGVRELEVFKDDSSRVLRHPDPDDVDLFSPGE